MHEGDALEFDFASLGPGLRVVGNLPYHISTPLLFHLRESADALRDIHVMLQKEVVERIVAAPGSSDYGRLSVMLQYRFDIEMLLDVPACRFQPRPESRVGGGPDDPASRPIALRARDERVFERHGGACVLAAAQDAAQHAWESARRRGFRNSASTLRRGADAAVDDFVAIARLRAIVEAADERDEPKEEVRRTWVRDARQTSLASLR